MTIVKSKVFVLGVAAAALSATALPAAAASYTQPGATMGSPAGANPPPGLYFANALNYGIGKELPGKFPDGDSTAVGVEAPILIWVPGWNFLGATYAASAAFVVVDVGVRSPNHAADTYLRGVFNPDINPITLSWNLGNGFFVSFGEHIYIPVNSEVVVGSSNAGVVSSAPMFEQRVSVSYLANDWVLSANGIVGIGGNDGVGVKSPDYVNVDWTIARNFGKWQVGAVGYGAWDIETTPINAGVGKASAVGIGGLVGYNFGVVDLQLRATHQIVTHGDSNYGREDTRVWSTLVIPIWNPPAPAPKPLVAKY
jgi:hypothetical protein